MRAGLTPRAAVDRWCAEGGTQRSLAAALDVAEGTVHGWRHRQASPHPAHAAKLGALLDVRILRRPTKRGALSTTVLTTIAAEPDRWRPVDLAEDLGLTPSQAKHQVDWLTRRGLVSRDDTPTTIAILDTAASAHTRGLCARLVAGGGGPLSDVSTRLGEPPNRVLRAARWLAQRGLAALLAPDATLTPTRAGSAVLQAAA